MKMDIRSYMKYNPKLADLLSCLPEHVVDTIPVRTYRPGEIIIRWGEGACDTFYIIRGVCCSTCNFVSGDKVWYRKATVGDIFGLNGVLNTSKYEMKSGEILTKTKVVLAVFSQELVHESFRKYPLFAEKITGSILRRLNDETWRQSECSFYPAYMGIITYLIFAYEFYLRTYSAGYTGSVKILEQRKEIAEFMGMNVRTLQRYLPVIVKEGLVKMHSKYIYIDAAHYEALKKRKMEYFSE